MDKQERCQVSNTLVFKNSAKLAHSVKGAFCKVFQNDPSEKFTHRQFLREKAGMLWPANPLCPS
jgi:hypothetical protein